MFRKANEKDLAAIAAIYEEIHTAQEQGETYTGWVRDVYPTAGTAAAALERDTLYVLEEDSAVLGAAILDHRQGEVYRSGSWTCDAPSERVLVLHTLVISPKASGRGLGPRFVSFYEDLARRQGCLCLRLDTNVKNRRARQMYRKLGYREAGTAPTVFNGIDGVELVLLEKPL